jgi:parvulin-like peptidyl-prolyl isomerase
VKERVEKGASFDELAAQVSTDPALRSKRGDLGVVSAGERGGVFDSMLRGLPLNKASDPLSTADGTVYLMVSERTQAQEVSEKNLGTLKTRALEAWLRREWDANSVNYCPKSEDDCFSNVKVDRALAQTGDVSRTKFEQAATATATARQRGNQPQLPFP